MANALLWPAVWQPCWSPAYSIRPGRYWDTWAWMMLMWSSLPRTAGLAVVLAWLLLWQGGRWKNDSGWLDRLGRVLGACWIGLGLANVTATWFRAFSL